MKYRRVETPEPAAVSIRSNSAPMIVTAIGFFMIILDTTVVNVALPTIQSELGGDITGLQWVSGGYAVVFASLLLSGGALSDLFGARGVFLAGLGFFAGASALCGLARSLLELNVVRLLQGIGAALTLPAMLALLAEAYLDRHVRARAVAIWAASGAVGQVAGPVLGGALTALCGWRSVFFINLPFGAAAMLLAYRGVARSLARRARSLDLPGQLAGIAALGLLAATLIEGGRLGWSAPPILAGFGLFIFALAAFIALERRSRAPMLPLDFFKFPAVSALLSIGAIINFAFYGQFFILVLFFQQAWGASPLAAGFAFLPMSASVAAANLTVGPRVGRIGGRWPMVIGQLLCAAGYLGLLGVGPSSGYLEILALFAIIGAGGGLVVPAMTSAFLEAVGAERAGIASGVLQASRQLGGVVGVALFGSLIARAGLVRGMHRGQAITAVAMLIGCLLTLRHVKRGAPARAK